METVNKVDPCRKMDFKKKSLKPHSLHGKYIFLAFINFLMFTFFNCKRGIQFIKYSLRDYHVKDMTSQGR